MTKITSVTPNWARHRKYSSLCVNFKHHGPEVPLQVNNEVRMVGLWHQKRKVIKQWNCSAVTGRCIHLLFKQTFVNYIRQLLSAFRRVSHKRYWADICQQPEINKQADFVKIHSLALFSLFFFYSRILPCTAKNNLCRIKRSGHKSFLIRAASVLPEFFY